MKIDAQTVHRLTLLEERRRDEFADAACKRIRAESLHDNDDARAFIGEMLARVAECDRKLEELSLAASWVQES